MANKPIIEKWYYTPVWAINALHFGGKALENYQTYSQQGEDLESLIFWGAGAVASIGLALTGGKDCVEKIKDLYYKNLS
jgi:hypothetical protein